MKESVAPQKRFPTSVFNTLASVKFAVAVVIILTIACVAGTLTPKSGLYSSWWFLGLLGTLAASVATCSTRRFATVRRTTGYARGRALGSMLTHISFLLILAGAVIRGAWGVKGYVEFREGQVVRDIMTDQGRQPLPFAVQLAKFEIETYNKSDGNSQLVVAWPEKQLKANLPVKLGVEQAFDAFKITVLKYIPDFVVDTTTKEVSSRSGVPRNPAILVVVNGPSYHNHRWLFAKFPDFSMQVHNQAGEPDTPSPLQMVYVNSGAPQVNGPIKSFKSTLRVADSPTAKPQTVAVEVNRPFKHAGYTFYQSGYNPNDLSYASLQVVKDPGVPVVYAGFSLMIVGLFIVFYLNPWLNERKKGGS